MSIQEIAEKLWQAYSSIPWLGAFIVSLIGNAIPYTTIPYLIWIMLTAPEYKDPLIKTSIIVSAGIGAALGKVIVYSMGRAAHHVLPERVKANMEMFAKLFEKWGFLAIFVFAASPLPDDILYIPLGVAGYNPILFFTAVALGKIVITAAAVAFSDIVSEFTGGASSPWFIATLVAVSIVLTVLIARIDWFRVASAARRSVIEAITVLAEEIVRALIPSRRSVEVRKA